jgi:hypothetical protein
LSWQNIRVAIWLAMFKCLWEFCWLKIEESKCVEKFQFRRRKNGYKNWKNSFGPRCSSNFFAFSCSIYFRTSSKNSKDRWNRVKFFAFSCNLFWLTRYTSWKILFRRSKLFKNFWVTLCIPRSSKFLFHCFDWSTHFPNSHSTLR